MYLINILISSNNMFLFSPLSLYICFIRFFLKFTLLFLLLFGIFICSVNVVKVIFKIIICNCLFNGEIYMYMYNFISNYCAFI